MSATLGFWLRMEQSSDVPERNTPTTNTKFLLSDIIPKKEILLVIIYRMLLGNNYHCDASQMAKQMLKHGHA
jgi:hypothetical protein